MYDSNILGVIFLWHSEEVRGKSSQMQMSILDMHEFSFRQRRRKHSTNRKCTIFSRLPATTLTHWWMVHGVEESAWIQIDPRR